MKKDLPDRPTALYRFYDADDALLYVGITHDLRTRWSTHRYYQPWWHLVARKTYEWYEDRSLAGAAEKAAVEHEKPRFDASHLSRAHRVDGDRYEDPRKAKIAKLFRADIDSGAFPRGRMLPFPTILAAKYQTSPATMSALMWDLCERRVLEGHGRRCWPAGSRLK
ncbi:hypothetical protein OG455_41445 [Kitasatospora sp. NBC_01287]|uniref:GIY-YIG nuclease family protein n=1 Tax=Kitasatospora sp. NBC_01287 TaxID=2903573 RepID=UPI00224CFCED|nr:GIY-YIG nuclease family protein [Kitasatospora sp. NBC_01287]MCX4750949.1 hypothetical protein [Kitasatospora sp. NBC_01287]MCX4751800.1 hypothetical protein [Kitasatospora sp. NBC_01287]MCX4751908.1 hypothetical protein [Kitasatospora sp. NBC_01287]